MSTSLEKWASGDAYEHFMGRWSKDVAALFLNGLESAENTSWLDVGCGTGALSGVIASTVQPNLLAGLDLSFDFVQYAKHRTHSVNFINGSAVALPVCNDSFDFVVSGLALNFVPQPQQALREFVRVVKPGGIVSAYVWDYAGKMEFLRYFWDAAVTLNPHALGFHEGHRFPICHPDPLERLWKQAGLTNISIRPLDAITVFENFESYWLPFTFGNFPAPLYALSLDDRNRADLRDRLQAALPIEDDGSIHLIARAWAVSGLKS